MFRATVDSEDATFISASPEHPVEITNTAGDKLFRKTAPDVDSEDTELGKGASVTITDGNYLISASKSEIAVREVKVGTFEEIAATGKVTLSGLPIEDPKVAGELWNKEGAVQVSAG